MKKIFQYQRKNCCIPTSGHCFIKSNKYFTNKDSTEEFRDFIRNEKYRSGVMTSARIRPFCKKYDNNISCFDGTRIHPRNLTQRNSSLFI